jgi:hypothetical protein
MCFVSYIPTQHGYLLGSNRDENHNRKPAILPQIVENKAGRLIFPKDGAAGGTWIAAREDGNAAVLLNGAFECHKASPPYRHSRGIIIPSIMQSKNPGLQFEWMDLDNIEPFTLIAATPKGLEEWRWDGQKKWHKPLNPSEAHCWSSATLYNHSQIQARSQWFFDAYTAGNLKGADDLMQWQSTGGFSDKDFDIILKRPNGIETISTTIVHKDASTIGFDYLDLLSGLRNFQLIDLIP